MTPILRGEHFYEVTEGRDELPTTVKVHRVDNGQIEDDTEEIMAKLTWTLPSELYRLGHGIVDPSTECLTVTINFSEPERKKRTGGVAKTLRVPKAEVDARLQQVPHRLD